MVSVQEQQQPELQYKIHPAATLFPMMDERELFSLAEDISRNGLLEPVILYHGEILDGRNRLEACKIASIKPKFAHVNGEIGSPTLFVVSKNLHRRHLTPSQRGAIGAEVVELLKEEFKKNQGRRNDLQTSTPIGEEVRPGTVAAVAKQVQAGEGTVQRALAVKREDPEAFEKIKSGEITAWTAHEQLSKKPAKVRAEKRGIRIYKDEPFEAKTPYQIKRANGAKERLITGLSTINGICIGLSEVDVPMVFSVCDEEEKQTWIEKAKELSSQLRAFAKKLEEATCLQQQS